MFEFRFLSICYLIASLKGVEGATSSLDVTPDDTAVLAGASATLQCSVNRADTTINWIRDPLGSPVPVVAGCVVQAGHENDYNVSADAANGDCNLIIKSTATAASVAKRYNCLDTTAGFNAAADVVVLDSHPAGSQNATNAEEGEYLGLSCDVKYYPSSSPPTLQPTFEWSTTGPAINVITNIANNTHASTTAAIKVPAGPAVIQATCTVTFPAGTVYTPYSWNSTAFSVPYPPRNDTTSIYPNDTLHVGMVLTCYAEADPAVTSYKWTTTEDARVTDGSTYKLTMDGQYSYYCNATNEHGSGYDSLLNVNVSAAMTTDTTEAPPTTTPKPPDGTIGTTTVPSVTTDGGGDNPNGPCPWWCILVIVLCCLGGCGCAGCIIGCCGFHNTWCCCYTCCGKHCTCCKCWPYCHSIFSGCACCHKQEGDKKSQNRQSERNANLPMTNIQQMEQGHSPKFPQRQPEPDVINGRSIPPVDYPLYDPSSPSGHMNQAVDPNAIVYAELQPRSRQPIVEPAEPSHTVYAPIRQA